MWIQEPPSSEYCCYGIWTLGMGQNPLIMQNKILHITLCLSADSLSEEANKRQKEKSSGKLRKLFKNNQNKPTKQAQKQPPNQQPKKTKNKLKPTKKTQLNQNST